MNRVRLIDAHLRHLRAAGKAERTIVDRNRVLRRADRALQPYGVEHATKGEIIEWLGHPDWSPNTRKVYRFHLVEFLRWAARERHLDLGYDPGEIPTVRVPRYAPHPATDQQLGDALRRLGDPWRLAVLLAAYSGLRACEIARVRREDITERTLRVRGKGGRVDEVVTHPAVWAAVRDRPAGPLVTRPDGSPTTAAYITNTGSRRLRRAGVDCTMHQFRAWYATSLLRRHGNLRVVQELMRHASVATTERYTMVTSDEREHAILLLPELGSALQPVEDAADHRDRQFGEVRDPGRCHATTAP